MSTTSQATTRPLFVFSPNLFLVPQLCTIINFCCCFQALSIFSNKIFATHEFPNQYGSLTKSSICLRFLGSSKTSMGKDNVFDPKNLYVFYLREAGRWKRWWETQEKNRKMKIPPKNNREKSKLCVNTENIPKHRWGKKVVFLIITIKIEFQKNRSCQLCL